MLRWLSILLYMFAFYGIIYILSGETIYDFEGTPIRNIDYIKKIGASLLPIYPMYVFAKKKLLTVNLIYCWTPIFILLSIYSFYQYYNHLLNNAILAGSSDTEFTNNLGYVFVSLLPLVFIKQKNTVLQYFYIAICAIFIVAGVKRGAILIGGIAIIYFFLVSIRNSKGKKKFSSILILSLAAITASYYISNFIETSDYFSYRLQNTLEGNTSGRDQIFSEIWEVFSNEGFFQMLFGNGANSSIYFTGLLAHNDWLEILINQGLLGVIIFSSYNINLYKSWIRYKANQDIGVCLGGLFIVLFLKTFFSMSYTEYTLYTCIAFGYCAAYISRNQQVTSIHVKRA